MIGSLISLVPLQSAFQGPAGFLEGWIVFWCVGWVAILLHELGHAVVGQWLGLTILRFYVIPLEIRLRPLSLHFARRVFGRDLGGAVVFMNASNASRRDRVLLSLAGPLANLGSGGALIGFAYAAPGKAPELVACMVGISLTLAIANLVPFDSSDGAMVLKVLLRHRTSAPPPIK